MLHRLRLTNACQWRDKTRDSAAILGKYQMIIPLVRLFKARCITLHRAFLFIAECNKKDTPQYLRLFVSFKNTLFKTLLFYLLKRTTLSCHSHAT
jgi:hypothetical protein